MSKSPESCSSRFSVDTPKIISNYRGKNIKFMVDNPSRHYLSQVIRVNSLHISKKISVHTDMIH